MTKLRATASACALLLLAACEQALAPPPALAPSPAVHATAAAITVGAPAADTRRASAVLASAVSGWNRPRASGPAPQPTRAEPLADAAAFAAPTTPEILPGMARALDRLLSATAAGKPGPR
jgi:hypothetical protein